jgi:hypothetical protein
MILSVGDVLMMSICAKLKVTINKIIKFILKLPSCTYSDFSYNELKVFKF